MKPPKKTIIEEARMWIEKGKPLEAHRCLAPLLQEMEELGESPDSRLLSLLAELAILDATKFGTKP